MRRSKYGAVKTTVDGIRFDSKREAKRYGELKLLEKAGKIHSLVVHPPFGLHSIHGERVCGYEADFSYYDKLGCEIVEDVKGVKTAIYRLKKKWMLLQYGIEIRET